MSNFVLYGLKYNWPTKTAQFRSKYVLEEVAYIEDLKIPGKDPEALARCLGGGWDKYYKDDATTIIKRHPGDGGKQLSWSVPGFVVEQLREIKWIPMRVWATKGEERQELSKEFSANVAPKEVLKVNKDLLEAGSVLIPEKSVKFIV